MILDFGSALRAVFTIFGAFWVLVLVALFIGVGALSKKRERALEQGQHGGAGDSH